jgi:hypothetical protein
VPFFGVPEKWRKEIWDDGTHFTPAGYDLVGKLIAERLAEIISAESSLRGGEQDGKKSELKRDTQKRRIGRVVKMEM